ncbi:helix-turn-helix domain-containing protein [Allobranchiibius sp. CTAmp26]|uniref:helix-turn-helix domain-containing protein n=1 Tax=Allobranchiibius sp. CTAmp26 TaxID=2815214 RepID=UPI001AA0D324|nr:helix-turn-helix domain-containing protein [Allobranchiibius sp. CTAmp26]MBO1755578.1 helix-turn-helix domain-containing protein [Allobranchiibius sp. CTAmp26]
MPARFVQIADVAETLNISARQAYGLVSSGELPAIKVGKSWRVEVAELENYIQRAYADTRTRVESGTIDVD